ncbi:hypothetical protein [Yersinia enterocolitica]|uniref:hypothetical protein n=1 Tax=Yersinia enterocolitica TaxID=630 RepID=UPI000AD4AB8E|nr:hypothetical protein [Yersinia enterocolitica]
MNTTLSKEDVSDSYFNNCLAEFGNIENEMGKIENLSKNSAAAACTNFGCGTLSCTSAACTQLGCGTLSCTL